MKKYKLVKKYPGSPDLESIASKKDISGFYYINDGFTNVGKNLEKYPEFWEEVVEKNYEILSYQSKDKIVAPATNFAIEISKPEYWNIYSVKRL